MKKNNLTASHAQVTVKSSARLHMGFFDLNGGLGRKFGSIGLSLSAPSIVIKCFASPKDSVIVNEALPLELNGKVALILQNLKSKLELSYGLTLHLEECVDLHAGLGSGTQLALTVGAAFNQMYGLGLTTAQIATFTGRGGRSGIGIAAFDYGGLLIDGGRGSDTKVPPLLARYDFPAQWKVLLIMDRSQPGLNGNAELTAFNTLPVFSESLAAHLCRHVLMQAMPAMVEQDLNAFGESIQMLQAHTGDYFAPAQGGRYASPLVSNVLAYLYQSGLACFGQSSWGPTGFAVFESTEIANEYLAKLKFKFANDAIDWMLCDARNEGASIIASSDSE